ncbi:MAG: glycosyltransferase [Bacteroidaceae bacterium]|nr:glycosyltransferase [Bacteroidaceae bacterium]
MVTIRCLTYNHEPYIRQCLDGFVMQKTNFRFEAIVHDDASTDGTATIIKEYAEKYPDIIKPIFQKENQYSKHNGSISKIMNEYTHGKYIALCEGDDYWIDPLKLQKQVDFLETHHDYGICHTAYINTLSYKRSKPVITTPNDRYLEIILKGEYKIGTLTTLFRRDLYINLQRHDRTQNFKLGDSPLWIEFAHCSKIKYINDCTAVYRILNESASHSKNIEKELAFHQSCVDCRIFYSQLYNVSIPLSAQRTYMASIKTAFMHGNKNIARRIFLQAKSENLVTSKILILYIGTLIPIFGKIIKKIYYKI